MKFTLKIYAVLLCSFCISQTAQATYISLFETDVDTGPGDLFSATFDPFADFLSNTPSSTGIPQINVAPGSSIAGLAYDAFPDPTTPVPAPGSLPLLMGGLIIWFGVRRRKMGAYLFNCS